MGGIDDEEHVKLAKLLNQCVSHSAQRQFARQYPGLRHEGIGRPKVEYLFFERGDRAGFHVRDDQEMRRLVARRPFRLTKGPWCLVPEAGILLHARGRLSRLKKEAQILVLRRGTELSPFRTRNQRMACQPSF